MFIEGINKQIKGNLDKNSRLPFIFKLILK
jgi:hypothetical protein